MMRKKFIRDRTAEGYVDVAIVVIIVFAMIAGIMLVFPLFTAQQNLNATARQIAHLVEVTGQADSATLAIVTGNPQYVDPDSIAFDTAWHNASAKKIQLKTPFTITLTKQMTIPIMRPLGGTPIGIRVQLRSTAAGISEVWWKD